MKMIKRLLPFLMALVMILSIVGCGQEQAVTAEPETADVPETAAPAETAEPEAGKAPEKELPPPPDIDINSWEFLYVSPDVSVGRYQPPVRNIDGQYMDERCVPATVDFITAARNEGYRVYINVGFRNFEYTMFWYEKEMRTYGSSYEAAKHGFAPGCSEHSTGLAFDITDETLYNANYNNMHDETVADTEVYKWMAEHCAEYGFIVRYPEGKEDFYKMACYPGHFRYVGVEAATYIMENDLCLEEFLALYK